MRVFNATQEFIALVLAEAKIEKSDRLFQLLRDTRESHLLFREEIGEFVEELYEKGLHLHTIYRMSGPQQVVRPEDVPVHAEIIEWFSGKTRVAEQMFLKYIDFREP